MTMRFALPLAAALASALPAHAQTSNDPVKISAIVDNSSTYADIGGLGSVEAVRMAVEDFGGTVSAARSRSSSPKVELISADFGNQSADVGSKDPQDVAEQILRFMVEKAVHEGVVFVRDDGK